MKKYPHATIIILNWNGMHLLEANLPAVLSQDYGNFDILLADNNSSDGSREYMQQLARDHDNVSALLNNANLGYAEGNNRAIQKVLQEGKSEFAVILNNDVFVPKNWLKNLLAGFKINERIAICTSKLLLYYPYIQIKLSSKGRSYLKHISADDIGYHTLHFGDGFNEGGSLLELPAVITNEKEFLMALPVKRGSKNATLKVDFTGDPLTLKHENNASALTAEGAIRIKIMPKEVIQNAGSGFDEKHKFFYDKKFLYFDESTSQEYTDAGAGAAMAIRVDILKELGLFKSGYFMYFEDSELSYRYIQNGYKVSFVPDAICYHYFWGSNAGQETFTQVFYGNRNRLWFIRENFGFISFLYYYLRTSVRGLLILLETFMGKKPFWYVRAYIKVLVSAFGYSHADKL